MTRPELSSSSIRRTSEGAFDADGFGQGVLADVVAEALDPQERRRGGLGHTVLGRGLARHLAPKAAGVQQIARQIAEQVGGFWVWHKSLLRSDQVQCERPQPRDRRNPSCAFSDIMAGEPRAADDERELNGS